MSEFTEDQKKAARAIVQLWETGKFLGKPDLLVVLGDNAGITYGKAQTTENSGGLWKLIFVSYAQLGGKFLPRFAKYRDILYRKGHSGEKDALTDNQEFKDLLVKAAREDVIMTRAQDQHFDQNFFKPALWICDDFDLYEPLSLSFVYDFCIHSGPGSRWGDGSAYDRLVKWNEGYEAPEDAGDDFSDEQLWVMYMCQKRDAFLKSIPHAKTTAYRTGSYHKLMKEGGTKAWSLELPLEITFLRKAYTGASDKVMTLTQEIIDQM